MLSGQKPTDSLEKGGNEEKCEVFVGVSMGVYISCCADNVLFSHSLPRKRCSRKQELKGFSSLRTTMNESVSKSLLVLLLV